MVFISPWLFMVFAGAFNLANIFAAPSNGTLEVSTSHATPVSPHWIAYWDQWVSGENGPPSVSTVKGFNVLILSFLLSSGAADQADEWVQIGASTRSSIKKQYNNAGVKLMVSAFGATDAPTSAGENPTTLAKRMASWVKTYDLDGIDVDYEDFDAIDAGSAVNWLVTFTKVLRQQLPEGHYIITHAPIAPWFSDTTGSPYVAVNRKVGSMVDWYNVQFYSRAFATLSLVDLSSATTEGSEYTTCSGIVENSGDPYTKSSIFEIAATGVSLNKIVMGKPATAGDASGYVPPATLAVCVQQAKNAGWSAGVMVWQYPNAGSGWIRTVRSKSWPV